VKPSDKRRFNVAASRARDQVWLFHTATLNDLNPDDMRNKLLAYYSNPAAQPAGKPDWSRCGSNFERDVGHLIDAKKYRLIPQFEPFGPGGYRIDFVIEGLKSRLAVECDGPYHDDPEQIEQDMHRQRQLERCGWFFWRVSESNFRYDSEKAMSSLWRTLDELGIEPLSAREAQSSPQDTSNNTQLSTPSGPVYRSRIDAPEARSHSWKTASAPQMDLVPPPQMEFETRQRGPSDVTGIVTDARLGAALALSVVEEVKRSRREGFFSQYDICKVALAFLQADGQMGRKELAEKITNALGLPQHHDKRIDTAFETLERAGKVSMPLGANTISLIP